MHAIRLTGAKQDMSTVEKINSPDNGAMPNILCELSPS